MSSIVDTQSRHRTATNPLGPLEADRPVTAISGNGVSVEQRKQRGGFGDVAAAMIVFIATASSLPGWKSPRSNSIELKNFKTTGSRGLKPIVSPIVRTTLSPPLERLGNDLPGQHVRQVLDGE
jgi:hypothetical protein